MPVAGKFDGSPEDFVEMKVDVTVHSMQMLDSVA
jgi:hypothetical protein